jgi:predicted secreted protein
MRSGSLPAKNMAPAAAFRIGERRHQSLAGISLLIMILAVVGQALAPDARPMRTLHETDRETVLTLKVGDSFAVDLQAQLGTGRIWRARTNELAVLVRSSGGGADRPGAFENQHFEFRARKAGSADLVLEYLQPWDATTPAAKIFSITLKVHDP